MPRATRKMKANSGNEVSEPAKPNTASKITALAPSAAGADCDGDPVLPGGARGQRGDLRCSVRFRRLGHLVPAVRLHLPGGPGHRLQHLPDEPGAGGSRGGRYPARDAPRAGGHWWGDHLGRHRARRNVLRARRTAPGGLGGSRLRRRLRRAARHAGGALGARSGPHLGHRVAGLVAERTTSVSSSTPKATTKPTSAKATRGSTPSTENVPASTMPAEVITPPVTASPRSIPRRVPTTAASSRTRLIRKML